LSFVGTCVVGYSWRDLLLSGPGGGCFDVRDEDVEHLVAVCHNGILSVRGEEPVVPGGQLLGDDHGLGDWGSDPPVA
jgi:hypothetical protein